jgi:hypothetical protein
MNNLDKKEGSLYQKRKLSSRKRSGIKSQKVDGVKKDWGKKEIKQAPKKKGGIVKGIFIFSIGFFVFAVLFFLFQLIAGNGNVSTKNVDIEILGNTFTSGGEELPLQIQVTNRNSVPLEYSDLIIKYPDGAGETVNERVSLGTVKSGETVVEARDVVLFGRQGDLQEITTTIEYRIKGSNAIFHKDFSHFVTLNSAPIDLTVDAPSGVVSGQMSSFTITVRSNSEAVNEGVGVLVEYPIGFRFEDSNIEPEYGDNVWYLGDMSNGDEREITFSGVLFGEAGEERAFRFFVGPYNNGSSSELAQVYSSYIHNAALTRPFIGTQILVNGIEDETVSVRAGNLIPVEVKWSNNLPTRVDDVTLEIALSGNVLNESNIQNSGGFYDSNNKVIRWDKSTYPQFASLQPGSRGSLNFTLSSLPLYQNGSLVQSPEIAMSVSISGKKPTNGGSLENIRNSIEKIIQINSDLSIASDAYFSIGPFNNRGQIPPVVGEETQYTIIWTVTNSANPVSGAKVKTTLPSYVDYKNQFSPLNEALTYDSAKRELTWDVGAVSAGAGLTGQKREVSFLVGITPSISQVGSAPLLTGEVEVTGRDLFTGESLYGVDSADSIRISNDPIFQSQDGRVVAQ